MLLLSGSTLTAETGRHSGLINDVFKHDSIKRHVFAQMNHLTKADRKVCTWKMQSGDLDFLLRITSFVNAFSL